MGPFVPRARTPRSTRSTRSTSSLPRWPALRRMGTGSRQQIARAKSVAREHAAVRRGALTARPQVRVWAFDHPEHLLKVEVAAFAGEVKDLQWGPESKRIIAVGNGRGRCACPTPNPFLRALPDSARPQPLQGVHVGHGKLGGRHGGPLQGGQLGGDQADAAVPCCDRRGGLQGGPLRGPALQVQAQQHGPHQLCQLRRLRAQRGPVCDGVGGPHLPPV